MIEDKKNQIKIAENPEIALWEQVKQAREDSIKNLEKNLQVEKVFLEAAKIKLKELNS